MTIITEITSKEEAPTLHFRFKERDGKHILQQMWIVTTVHNPGIIVKTYGKWCDVRSVGPDESDLETWSGT